MSYITVNAYDTFNEDKRTGEQTLTPGTTFEGNLERPVGNDIIISFSSNGLTVTAIIADSQLQYRIKFDIKGYGRRQ